MIEGVEAKNVTQWATFFASQSETISLHFRETITIIHILAVVPATAAGAERSFSLLRRLQTWLDDVSEKTNTSRYSSLS